MRRFYRALPDLAHFFSVSNANPLLLATYLLVQASHPVWLVRSHGACGDSHLLNIPSNPNSRPPSGWQSQPPLTIRLPVFED
jgi:hypothetical protein